jgi:replicative DNA helicase
MSYFDSTVKWIEDGKAGLNEGLNMGFPRLRTHIPNVQKGTYYLIGGDPGAGKSTFTLNAFVLNPFEDIMKFPDKGNLKIFYFSFELKTEMILTKAITRKLYYQYGLVADVNYVLSRGKNRISQEIYSKVLETREYFSKLEDVLVVNDIPENPTGIEKALTRYAHENLGSPTYGTFTDEDGNDKQYVNGFIPNGKNNYTLCVIDHISLIKKERSFNVKANIDKMSEYMINLRNTYGISPVVVQQLNRSFASTDRMRLNKLEPTLNDFKDSGNTVQDAETVFALFNPRQFELTEYRGYDIEQLQDRFRAGIVLKNRYGSAQKRIPMLFIGESSIFEEMPKAEEMSPQRYELVTNIKTNV